MEQTPSAPSQPTIGGDYDIPFVRFQPYHFSTRQLARLLLLRGLIQDSRAGHGRYADDLDASSR